MIDDLSIQLCFDRGETSFPIPFQENASISLMHEGVIIWKHEEYIYRKFMWYYRVPQRSWVSGCLRKPLHKHCLQAVTVLFDYDLHEPTHVYFHACDGNRGGWSAWKDCEKTDDGALKVYVSLHRCSSYPRKGIYVHKSRYFVDAVRGNGRSITYRSFQRVDKSLTYSDGTLKAVAMSSLPMCDTFIRIGT